MRRPRPRLILGLGIPLLIIVVLLAAWAIDSSSASGKVPRNTSLAGRNISKMPEDRLATTVADLADHYATVPVKVRTSDGTFTTTGGDLGLKLDQAATVKAALDLDDSKALPERPLVWASSFVDQRKAPLKFTVDTAMLTTGLAGLSGNAAAKEPSLASGAEGVTVVSGASGRIIKADGVRTQLMKRAKSGEEPIVVDATVTDRSPAVSDADAQAFATKLTTATANGLKVTAGTRTATIPSATVRSWIGSKVVDGKLGLSLADDKVKAALTTALPATGQVKDAKISLVNGAVQITPSQDAVSCCAEDSAMRVLAVLTAGSGEVTVDPIVKKAAFTTEAAQKLGIKEPVGTTVDWKGVAQVKSFTTYYPCCAARVTNIHRIADLIRGTIVKPGETFSVNKVVGQRTLGKGFVVAGAIANGEHVDEVASHRPHVRRRGADQQLPPLLGELSQGAASVGRALPSSDPAGVLHAGDLVRQPRSGGQRHVGEVAHPQLSVRCLGEPDEDLVVGHRQAVVGFEVTIERVGQQDVRRDPPAPGLLLLGGQPANGVHGVGHPTSLVESRTTGGGDR